MNKLSQEYDNSIFDSVPSEFLLVGELFDHTLSNESSSVIQSLAAQSEMETKGLTNEIRLFLNPVDGIVNLHLSSEKKANYQLWILDLSGKTV